MTTDDIENYFGSTEKVAEFLESSEAVYQWRNRTGRLIPKGVQLKQHIEPGKLVFIPTFTKSVAMLQ